MNDYAVIVGLPSESASAVELASTLRPRGLECAFLHRWSDWRVSVYPDGGDCEIASRVDGRKFRGASIKLVLLFGEPERPVVDAEDANYQALEYDALLHGLCMVAAPALAARWSYVVAGYSDSLQQAARLGGDPLGLAATCERLELAGADEAVLFRGAAAYVRRDGTVGKLDTCDSPHGVSLPITLALGPARTEFIPYIGLLPEWLPFGDDFAATIIAGLHANSHAAYQPIKCASVTVPGDLNRLMIVAHSSESPAVHLMHCARQRSVKPRVVDLSVMYSPRCSDDEFDSCLVAVRDADLVYARPVFVLGPRDGEPQRMLDRHIRMLRVLQSRELPTLNPPGAGPTNISKPAHVAFLASQGLRLPASIATNDHFAAANFLDAFHGAIYKSAGWQRSLATRTAPEDLCRLELLSLSPTLFQEFIDGPNCRVHVLWNEAFPTLVESDSTDYRETGSRVRLAPIDLGAETTRSLVSASHDVGLGLSGCDLKWSSSHGAWFALEINRMPAFDGYDHPLGNPIAHGILKHAPKR